MKRCIRAAFVLILGLTLATAAWAQWSSDPMKNLALADKVGSDQVQPKVKPLPTGGWYVSWFAPPVGYSVYLQRLSPGGVERFRHDGLKVAALITGWMLTPRAMPCSPSLILVKGRTSRLRRPR